MHLTDLALRALSVEAGQKDFADDALPGLCVRVGKRTKTFMLLIGDRGNRRRLTLGAYPALSLSQARSKAKTVIGAHQQELRLDETPTVTFGEGFDRFIELHLKTKNKASTAAETERLIRRHLLPQLAKRRLEEITKLRMTELIDGLIETPSECRHVYTAAKTFFRFCERRGYVSKSPLTALEAPTRAGSRERFLAPAELPVFWSTAKNSGPYGAILQLLLLTGQRLGQIAALRGSFIDYDKQTISWPGELMKAGMPHTIPYGAMTATLLASLPVDGLRFYSWSSAHRKFLEVSGLAHFTRHDLRRTYSTLQASIGTPLHITELLLAHKGGQISGVAAIYNRYNFMDEMRRAVEAYEAHLATLVSS